MTSRYALLFVASLLTACASSPLRNSDEDKREATTTGDVKFPVIDSHTHTRFTGAEEPYSKIKQTREQYAKEWEEVGVVGAISHVSGSGAGFNADMKAKNVFHCFGIADKVDLVGLEKGLKSHDYRCVKIYLGYIHRFAYDAPYRPVYKIAEKYNVPVVFHTGDTYDTKGKLKYSDPLTIDEVAVDFPNVTFVIAHIGNPWIQSAAEVAYKNPNVYLDGSALLIGDLTKEDPQTVEKYVVEPLRWTFGYLENPAKLMYGTDWPLAGMKGYFEAFKKAIPRDQWCNVFFNNAVNVFRLNELKEKYKCDVR